MDHLPNPTFPLRSLATWIQSPMSTGPYSVWFPSTLLWFSFRYQPKQSRTFLSCHTICLLDSDTTLPLNSDPQYTNLFHLGLSYGMERLLMSLINKENVIKSKEVFYRLCTSTDWSTEILYCVKGLYRFWMTTFPFVLCTDSLFCNLIV